MELDKEVEVDTFFPEIYYPFVGKRVEVGGLTAMGVEAGGDNTWLLFNDCFHFRRRFGIPGKIEGGSSQSGRFFFQTVENEAMIVAIGFRMYNYSPVDSFLIESLEVDAQRICRVFGSVRLVGCLRVKRISGSVRAEDVCVPFNHRIPGSAPHKGERAEDHG